MDGRRPQMLYDGLSVRRLSGVILLVAGLLSVSCAQFGPRKLQSSHLNYNKAVQKAQMEEDLLNIVRLRYLDMPVSLSVNSISAQTSFSIGAGGEFGLVEGESSANISPGIGYTDRPTITFTPYHGKDFLDSLTEPIPAASVDADSVLAAARDNRRFQPDDDGGYRLIGTKSVPFLWVDPSNAAGRELLDELRLTKDATSFEMKNANQVEPPAEPSDFLAVRTRSLLEVVVYLSHGVDVPEAHERAGIARPEADLEPGTAVAYRDHWFFLPDADHASKRTFGLMQAIFLSQIVADSAQGAPGLTLPLN
jgi:hypothetical protein